MSRETIEFDAGGIMLRGWLQLPSGDGPHPVVVMAHGLNGYKEWLSGFSDAFCSAGLATLVYDHRNFGDSDGEPRQEIDPWQQVEDYRRAITYACSRADLDSERIGVWGTSMSGGHVLVVAGVDPRVRAVVSQVPMVDGYRNNLRLIPGAQVGAIYDQLAGERLSRLAGNPPTTIAAVSDDPAVPAAMPDADTYRWVMEQAELAPGFVNELTVLSIDRVLTYVPIAFMERIAPTPLLMIVSSKDVLTPPDLALEAYARALEPKRLLMLDGGHYAPYEERFDLAAEAAGAFLREHLGVAAPAAV